MKHFVSIVILLLLSSFAEAHPNPPEQFICQSLAANFPGTCLLHGESLLDANWIDCFSWYQYGPIKSLTGTSRACEQTVQNLKNAISTKGLCLCEQQGNFGAQLRKWTVGNFESSILQQFSRVEAPSNIPPGQWGKAMDLCSEALNKAQQDGTCP